MGLGWAKDGFRTGLGWAWDGCGMGLGRVWDGFRTAGPHLRHSIPMSSSRSSMSSSLICFSSLRLNCGEGKGTGGEGRGGRRHGDRGEER